jgi:AMP-binding enzyme C-terminal domain
LGAGQPNVEAILAEVPAIDTQSRKVTARRPNGEVVDKPFVLVVAAGVAPSYYGHNEFAVNAPGLEIKSGGEWISSIEIENLVDGHPKVELAAVIGVPDPKWEERPLLTVKLRAGSGPRARRSWAS